MLAVWIPYGPQVLHPACRVRGSPRFTPIGGAQATILVPCRDVSDYRIVTERSNIPYLYEIPGRGINGACPIVPTDDALRDELARTRRDNARLRDDLEAAPFSKGAPTLHPKRPGRKSGTAHGRHGQRPVPPRLDETHDAPLSPGCPHCGASCTRRAWPISTKKIFLPFARWCAASAAISAAARNATVGCRVVIRGKRPTPSARRPSNWGRTRSHSP